MKVLGLSGFSNWLWGTNRKFYWIKIKNSRHNQTTKKKYIKKTISTNIHVEWMQSCLLFFSFVFNIFFSELFLKFYFNMNIHINWRFLSLSKLYLRLYDETDTQIELIKNQFSLNKFSYYKCMCKFMLINFIINLFFFYNTFYQPLLNLNILYFAFDYRHTFRYFKRRYNFFFFDQC